ncbi:hypothetical protein CLG96_00120 [Sphingomonas oleivorans]|uniref:Uncharacterized protein n=1 Tax=Sphingomonas oleivorans TaxID=1735121 RepID=A0A2T5G3B2_9SPHN|nr:hypothetical protein [Sphingomonas oleivorans]PTQ13726.1 hypothetical protein CLG96_00120 [Sphingomonas oleivorans]
MAIIPFPNCPPVSGTRWQLNQPSQVNRSEWTGRRRVTILSEAPRWLCEVQPFDIVDDDAIWPWRAFLIDCQGKAHSFRLPAVRTPQISGITPRVNGGGQGGYSLVTDGWGASGTKLRRGQYVTINDQLLMLTADVVSASGAATISFKPWIRNIPADDALIVVDMPTALMSMADDAPGWDDSDFGLYQLGFACEESF